MGAIAELSKYLLAQRASGNCSPSMQIEIVLLHPFHAATVCSHFYTCSKLLGFREHSAISGGQRSWGGGGGGKKHFHKDKMLHILDLIKRM